MDYVALDLELTSLNIREAKLVALAAVPFDSSTLYLDKSLLMVVGGEHVHEIGNSAIFHGYTVEDLKYVDVEESEALDALINFIGNKIVVVHSTIDIRFLKEKLGSKVKGMRYIDVAQEYVWREQLSRGYTLLKYELAGTALKPDSLARELNVMFASGVLHNPLLDAVNTALVFLKMTKEGKKLKVRKV